MAVTIEDDKPPQTVEVNHKETFVIEVIKNKPFDGILNFRDVGETVHKFLGQSKVIEKKIYRSARLDDASESDKKRLRDEYGIKTIIDLRTVTEHANRLKKRQADLKIPALIATNASIAAPLQIPGMNYKEINMNGRGFERSLLFKLKPWSIAQLIWLMILGYRMDAISILGREVMQPRGLVGLGKDSLDYCGTEITEILEVYANPANYPILIHCTQGKDRTGLIVSLLLFLLGVPTEAIDFDYCMSEEELLPEKPARMAEITSIGLTEEFATCPANWISSIDTYLREKYGGVAMYVRMIGLTARKEARIKDILDTRRLSKGEQTK